MNQIEEFLEQIFHMRIVNSIMIILISVILYRGIIYLLGKGEEKDIIKGKRRKTYLRLTKNIIRYVFVTVTVLALLQLNGIDVSSILAGVGILGVVLGLAIQDWLKDIIRGSGILSDHYFEVGDIVKYKDMEGKVLVIGLKTTKIQDLKTDYIVSIANRNIEEIQVVSNVIYIDIPMPYETPLEKAEEAISDIVLAVAKNNHVEGCEYKSVTEFAESSIKYLIKVTCNPVYKLQVRRDALRTILVEMNQHQIAVPYTQIDIHEKQ